MGSIEVLMEIVNKTLLGTVIVMKSSKSVDDDENNDVSSVSGIEERHYDGKNVTDIDTSFSSDTPLSQSTECKGSADCFRGIVTEIVDGDTLDVNNVRVRLAMVNTILKQ